MDTANFRLQHTASANTTDNDHSSDSGKKQHGDNDNNLNGSVTETMDTTSPDLTKVTVGVVGSPEMFGNPDGRDSGPVTSRDERLIERCDQLNHSRDGAQSTDQQRIQCIERHDMVNQGNDTMLSSGIENSRPLKKRYNPPVEEVKFVPLIQPQSPILPVPPAEFTFPTCEHFQHAMNQWDWASVDTTKIPVILRGNEKFAAVHIVQLKLLSKFPPMYPPELKIPPLISHKMTVIESWIFNSINAVICKFEYGYQLFSTEDELVRLVEVDRFYWSVKMYNLTRMISLYSRQMSLIKTSHLNATVTRVKDYVEAELQNAEKEFQRSQLCLNSQIPNGQGQMIQKTLQR